MDAVWNWLAGWIPELTVGKLEVRDLLSLVVAVLGAILARQAIRMGHTQNEIAARQAQISEMQHAIFVEKLARDETLNVDYSFAVRTGMPMFVISVSNPTLAPIALKELELRFPDDGSELSIQLRSRQFKLGGDRIVKETLNRHLRPRERLTLCECTVVTRPRAEATILTLPWKVSTEHRAHEFSDKPFQISWTELMSGQLGSPGL